MDKRSLYILLTIISFGLISFFMSCERDDVCADQAITPFLVIDFTNDEDNTELDAVDNLQVMYLEITENDTIEEFVFDVALDRSSVTLPLPTDKDAATYVFYQNFALELEEVIVGQDTILSQVISTETEIDTITFNYRVVNEYVSRACGFRATYMDLMVDWITEGNDNNFIESRPITDNSTIDNEEAAHLRFPH